MSEENILNFHETVSFNENLIFLKINELLDSELQKELFVLMRWVD